MKLFAKRILLSTGWAENQLLTIEMGIIAHIEKGIESQADCVKNIVIPGMVNCHSHAFQRAFAGFSEQGSEGKDSFWTWRNVMYKFLENLTPEDAEIIATQLYIEMVKMGYTRVAEFHYLHHDIDGKPYPELATMAKAIFSAAQQAGIGLTLLPVLYRFSGFGSSAPTDGQKRFINTTEQFNKLVSECDALTKQYRNTNLGIAPHSLRAVDKISLKQAVNHIRKINPNAPIHIHIAEQQKEVDDCVTHFGKRPIQWLVDNIELDKHWCLIHATHIDEHELSGVITSGAIAGICPTTEANLGDGIFPTTDFLNAQGTLAIGSDSHISVNPVEELRWLEYAQRLIRQQRAVLASTEQPSVGLNLWQKAAKGGAQSTNANCGEISISKQADLIVLDDDQISTFANSNKHLLDSMIFASQYNMVNDVMINGQWVVENKQHPLAQTHAEKFKQLLAKFSAL